MDEKELQCGVENTQVEEAETEETLYELPVFEDDADDEELATLTPEEALVLKKRRAEEAAKRLEEYEVLVAEGEALLGEEKYAEAELVFEKALLLQKEPTQASVGYWCAKTQNFSNPDALIGEYAQSSIESLEFDVGYRATEEIKARYQDVFRRRVEQLKAEEVPLKENLEDKQAVRREVIKGRVRRHLIVTLVALVPLIACVVLAVVFGLKIPTVRDNRFIAPTIGCAVGGLVAFIVWILLANKLINALRMRNANERLSSSKDGLRLIEIRDYITLYEALLD